MSIVLGGVALGEASAEAMLWFGVIVVLKGAPALLAIATAALLGVASGRLRQGESPRLVRAAALAGAIVPILNLGASVLTFSLCQVVVWLPVVVLGPVAGLATVKLQRDLDFAAGKSRDW